ncbi:MAG: hypothetical protein HY268_28395 [Deltaproteobacteria bacterium]|nr:hypothetical protein [Deltaproteobacteria bacterium]
MATAQTQNAPPEVSRVLQEYVNENPRLPAHDTEFTRVYPDHEIIGQQGCGDLTMNLWNVAYVNSALALGGNPVLIFLHKEPLASRTYSCLVKWKPKGENRSEVTIEDVRFFANAATVPEMVWMERGGQWVQCSDEVEFAVSNQQIIRDGRIVDVSRLSQQFSDLRHLLQMPNLNPRTPLPSVAGDPGRPRFYFGRVTQDDIWFGEAQLLNDVNLQRAAMTGPVFFSRLYEGLGASVEQVRGAMQLAEYTEVSDPRLELAQGEFRFVPEDDTQVEMYLRRSTYGWTIIGLNKTNDKILALACEGNPATRTGHILEEAARKLKEAGAPNALLVDEGADVFQTALLGHNLPKVKVAGGGPELDMTVPLKRTRLRATFIFARKKN